MLYEIHVQDEKNDIFSCYRSEMLSVAFWRPLFATAWSCCFQYRSCVDESLPLPSKLKTVEDVRQDQSLRPCLQITKLQGLNPTPMRASLPLQRDQEDLHPPHNHCGREIDRRQQRQASGKEPFSSEAESF